MLKWQSLYRPLFGPQNEHSIVNEFMRENSFHITTLAVDSFDF